MSDIKAALAANKIYAENFGCRADLAGEPSKRLAVLSCMDTRVEPKKLLGLEVGEANIIRNAGGRVTEDAIRSLVVCTKLLGVDTIFVMHHTNCGMAQRTDEQVVVDVSEGVEGGVEAAEQISWMSIAAEPEALIEDVRKLRANPLIADDVPIYGLLMDIETGAVTEVAEAVDLGSSRSPAN